MPSRPAAPPADALAWCDAAREGVGLYVHVPFCSHRCGYCDFAAFSELDTMMPEYVDRVVAEVRRRVAEAPSTVFVGGGTPSRLGPGLLHRLLAAIPRRPGAEVTVEMNPESATPEVIAAAVEGGATRLSFGLQSAASHVLAFLERAHGPDTAAAAVAAARDAGVTDLNLDLIYGVPGESASDWAETLDFALSLEPEHLSCYALTVETGTPLGRGVAAGAVPAPDDDIAAARLAHACRRLEGAGYTRYEVSNWSRARPCVHNLRYWSGGAYLGVGNGAHSYDPATRTRSWNHRHPRTYLSAADPVAGSEALDAGQARDEAVMLGIRRCAGIEWPPDAPCPADLLANDLVRRQGSRVVLTAAGMSLAGAVTLALLAALDEVAAGKAGTRW